MTQTRDLTSVVKMIDFLLRDGLAAGTHSTKTFDLRAPISSSDLSEVVTSVLLGISVEFGAAGTIDITVVHSDNEAFGDTAHSTIAQMSAADGEQFYIADLKELKRYVHLQIVVTGTVQTISITGAGDYGMREPVVQLGTALTVTNA
jgi:hypothetical protein